MTEDFAADAFSYLLDDMDGGDRRAFEGRLARFPAARIALSECADALTMLRRQAADVPFFGRVTDFDFHPLLAGAKEDGRNNFNRGASKPPQSVTRHV
jgi:hypothetical protein